jgi:hypothetical protein
VRRHPFHPALLLLLRLRFRAAFRRFARGLYSARGVAFALLALLIFGWMAASVFLGGRPTIEPLLIVTWGPVVITGLALLSVFNARNVLAFSPAEVNLLLSGPFGWGELLAYKLAGIAAAAVWLALLLSLFYGGAMPNPGGATLGLANALFFMSLVGTALALGGSAMRERARSPGRRFGLVLLGAAAGAGGWFALAGTGWHGLEGTVHAVYETPVLGWIFAPAHVFVFALLAEGWAGAVGWNLLGLGMNAGLLVAIYRLDADYRDAALRTSERAQQRIERIRRGDWGGVLGRAPAGPRFSVPDMPWWGGVGPNVWRQLVALTRRGRLLGALLLAFAGAPLLVVTAVGPEGDLIAAMTGMGVIFLLFVLPGMLPFGFRGDVELMETLKGVPVGSRPLAFAQLAVPVLLFSAFVSLAVSGALAAGLLSALGAGLVGLYMLPIAVAVNALDDVFFLLYPVRQGAMAGGDLHAMVREFVVWITRFVLLALTFGLAAVVGGVAALITGAGAAAFVAGSWLVLSVLGALLVLAVAWAFDGFDVTGRWARP